MQRKAISDHEKRNTESHLKLACERLQELQVSSTLTAANFEEVQTEMVTAMKKIKELSEAVLKNEGLQDLREKIAGTNEKLQELQNREDAFDRLSALQDEFDVIKKKVKELSKNVSSDGKLLELQDAISGLQKSIPRIDNLQGLRKEVLGTNKKLQKIQEAVTRLEKRSSDPNITSPKDRRILVRLENVEREVRDIRQNLQSRDRVQRHLYYIEPTTRDFLLSCLFLFVTFIGLILNYIIKT